MLLVPRRLAARAAAEYIARERGEVAGASIGYATRLDSKVGKATRLIAMTHGVFLARLQADPELGGVSAVLFDEVHERSLDSDLGLALALDAAAALRPDLRIVAMSATLDGERFARLLGHPPRIESEGKAFPLTLVHEGRDSAQRIEPQMAAAIKRALGRASRIAARLPARGGRDRADRRRRLACCPPTSSSTAFTAKSTPPRSAPRWPRPRRARASWCWRARSPRPA